jgi:hypothetical protein
LTTLFGNDAMANASPIEAPHPRKKLGWLPILTVLFCISYGLMTMLIIEQGATIESQRVLIHELFRDSAELSANKMKAQIEKHKADAQRAQSSPVATPSTQIPSTQAQSNPSSQAAQQNRVQRPQFQMPSRPASDQRQDPHALITI